MIAVYSCNVSSTLIPSYTPCSYGTSTDGNFQFLSEKKNLLVSVWIFFIHTYKQGVEEYIQNHPFGWNLRTFPSTVPVDRILEKH